MFDRHGQQMVNAGEKTLTCRSPRDYAAVCSRLILNGEDAGLALVPDSACPYRPAKLASQSIGQSTGRRAGLRSSCMASISNDDIDILAKAKRALDRDYAPSDDEEYMSPRQLDYFRVLLLEWKKSILSAAENTLQSLQDGPIREPDLNDRASSETDWGIELRTRDRQRKLIAKIDAALRRIDEGEYGWCEVTGEPIGINRLIARPIATMTVEAQQAHERREKISRED
jgi:DnaK suppressor protein